MPTVVDKRGNASFDYSLSKRERELILRLLNENINSNMSNDELINILSNNIHVLKERANNILELPSNDFSQITAPSEFITMAVKKEIINETNFSWIDTSNDRLCNYVWSYIRSLTQYPVVSNLTRDIGIQVDGAFETSHHITHLYDQLRLDISPTTNTSKKSCIIAFFDMLNVTNDRKIADLDILKTSWQAANKKIDVKLWVEKCDTEWAWNYLFSNLKTGNNKPPVWFIDRDKSSTVKDCIITLFDLLNDIPPARELVLRKMKSAWSQKSFRDKSNDKKAVNVVLLETSIRMLEAICTKSNRRKNEVITRLIKEEYEKTCK